MLFNYKTGVYDEPKDDLDYSMYIPQHNAAQQLYKVNTELGLRPRVAAIEVLKVIVKANGYSFPKSPNTSFIVNRDGLYAAEQQFEETDIP